MDDSYTSALAEGAEKRMRRLEMDIMEDVVRRIRKAGKITDSADWQIQRLTILGNSSEDIRKLVSRAVDGNEEAVRKIYEQVIEAEYTRDKELYEKIGKEFIPYEQNEELKQLTEALIRQSTADLTNITKSTGFMIDINGRGKLVYSPLSEIYTDYIDQAVLGMAEGAYDYNTMVRRCVGQMTRSGLRSDYAFSDTGTFTGVQYASGWHNRVDVAARRALLTGMAQLSGQITSMNAQKLGTNYFEVGWHPNARPEHALWQGKVYSKEDLVRVCGLGTGPGLNGWNCRHTYYPFIPGVSERNYTDEWLAEQNAREETPRTYRGKEYTAYEATQQQRRLETALRAKREEVQLLMHSDIDPDILLEERCKYQAQLDGYKAFTHKMGLQEQTERIYTGRTRGRISPSPQAYAKWQMEQYEKAVARAREKAEKARRADMDAAERSARDGTR